MPATGIAIARPRPPASRATVSEQSMPYKSDQGRGYDHRTRITL